MDKAKYYIKVGTGEINQDPTVSEWEYEIEGTEEEIGRLQQLFDRAGRASDHSFLRALTPYAYHQDEENVRYDEALSSIYQMIYDMGDEKVKEQIKTMDVLD